MRKLISLFLVGFCCCGALTVSGCKKEDKSPLGGAADAAKDAANKAGDAAEDAKDAAEDAADDADE